MSEEHLVSNPHFITDGTQIQHGKILTGWDAVDKRIRDSDESKVEDYKEDVDTLLVFAGLFSAVTTALLLDSYKSLQEDRVQTTNILLAQVYLHMINASTPLPNIDSIFCIATSSCPFTPSAPAKHINYLWFSSLILSLVTASFGMLVKQWLREYLSGNLAVGKSHLRLRFFRYIGMAKWRVFKIASLLPLLLQLALALFFAGLCLFSSQINSDLGSLTTAIVAIWAILLVLILSAPALSPRCPYKVTFLKEFMHYIRVLLNEYMHLDYGTPLAGRNSSVSDEIATKRKTSFSPFEEESFAVNQASLSEDMDILLAIDCELLDDGLLESGIAGLLIPIASQSSSDMAQVRYRPGQLIIPWVLNIIDNRVQNEQATRLDLNKRIMLRGQLTIKAWSAVVNILSHTLLFYLQNSETKIRGKSWIADAITILISDSGYPLPINGQKALSECLRKDAYACASIICERSFAPIYSLFPYKSNNNPIGQDAFVVLLDYGIGDILRHLHGDDLLDAIHDLLRCRYGCVNCTHKSLPAFLGVHVYTAEPVGRLVRLDIDGGLREIVDILLDELENVFQSPPSSFISLSVLTTVEVAFTYIQRWGQYHSKRIAHWMSQYQALLWYLQLAKPAHCGHDGALSRTASQLVVTVTKKLFMSEDSEMTSSERKTMLRIISDILKADCDPLVVEDPSILRIDHVGLCELLLDLLRWQLQAPIDPIPSMQRALVNAWRATLERLDETISMTSGPPTDTESAIIPRLLSLAQELTIPSELEKAMEGLSFTLGTRLVGPTAGMALRKWRVFRRRMTSDHDSLAKDQDRDHPVPFTNGGNDSQSRTKNNPPDENVASSHVAVVTDDSGVADIGGLMRNVTIRRSCDF
ncbi:hypothetical protein QCA50_005598 [Cerrena zonata]|uniref:DUF6535 domain-containing protein n=1 Tax=Cerrena zonata TaxID=2478898 RepID=A0AAW0GH43_9APHY